MYTASRSGRSSRSTFTFTKSRFMRAAVSVSSNDSCAITWHQWEAEEPIESRIGGSSARARSSASGPQGYQSTGFSACWSRYGLVSAARRFTDRSLEPASGVGSDRAGGAGRLRRRGDRAHRGALEDRRSAPPARARIAEQHVEIDAERNRQGVRRARARLRAAVQDVPEALGGEPEVAR